LVTPGSNFLAEFVSQNDEARKERLDTLFEQFEKYKLYAEEETKLAREQSSNPTVIAPGMKLPQVPRSNSQTKDRNFGRDSSASWRKNNSAEKLKFFQENNEAKTKENLLRALGAVVESFKVMQELHPAPTRDLKGHYNRIMKDLQSLMENTGFWQPAGKASSDVASRLNHVRIPENADYQELKVMIKGLSKEKAILEKKCEERKVSMKKLYFIVIEKDRHLKRACEAIEMLKSRIEGFDRQMTSVMNSQLSQIELMENKLRRIKNIFVSFYTTLLQNQNLQHYIGDGSLEYSFTKRNEAFLRSSSIRANPQNQVRPEGEEEDSATYNIQIKEPDLNAAEDESMDEIVFNVIEMAKERLEFSDQEDPNDHKTVVHRIVREWALLLDHFEQEKEEKLALLEDKESLLKSLDDQERVHASLIRDYNFFKEEKLKEVEKLKRGFEQNEQEMKMQLEFQVKKYETLKKEREMKSGQRNGDARESPSGNSHIRIENQDEKKRSSIAEQNVSQEYLKERENSRLEIESLKTKLQEAQEKLVQLSEKTKAKEEDLPVKRIRRRDRGSDSLDSSKEDLSSVQKGPDETHLLKNQKEAIQHELDEAKKALKAQQAQLEEASIALKTEERISESLEEKLKLAIKQGEAAKGEISNLSQQLMQAEGQALEVQILEEANRHLQAQMSDIRNDAAKNLKFLIGSLRSVKGELSSAMKAVTKDSSSILEFAKTGILDQHKIILKSISEKDKSTSSVGSNPQKEEKEKELQTLKGMMEKMKQEKEELVEIARNRELALGEMEKTVLSNRIKIDKCNEMEAEHSKLQKELSKAMDIVERQKADLKEADQELSRVKAESSRLPTLESELDETRATIRALKLKIEGLESEALSKEESARVHREASKKLKERCELLEKEVQDLKTSVNERSQEVGKQRGLVQSLEEQIEELRKEKEEYMGLPNINPSASLEMESRRRGSPKDGDEEKARVQEAIQLKGVDTQTLNRLTEECSLQRSALLEKDERIEAQAEEIKRVQNDYRTLEKRMESLLEEHTKVSESLGSATFSLEKEKELSSRLELELNELVEEQRTEEERREVLESETKRLASLLDEKASELLEAGRKLGLLERELETVKSSREERSKECRNLEGVLKLKEALISSLEKEKEDWRAKEEQRVRQEGQSGQELMGELREKREALEKAERECLRLRAQSEERDTKCGSLEAEITKMTLALEVSEKNNATEKERNQKEQSQLQSALKECQREVEERNQELKDCQEKLKSNEELLLSANSSLRSLEELKLKEAAERELQKEDMEKRHRQEVEELGSQVEQKTISEEKLRKEIIDLEEDRRQLEEIVESNSKQMEEKDKDIDDLFERIDRLEKSLESKDGEIELQEKLVDEKDQQIQYFVSQNTDYGQQIKELEASNESLKEALDANKSLLKLTVVESMNKQKMAEAKRQEIAKLRNTIELMKIDMGKLEQENRQLGHEVVRAKTESNLSIQKEFDQLVHSLQEKEKNIGELNSKRKETEDKLTEQRLKGERLEKVVFDSDNKRQELEKVLEQRDSESKHKEELIARLREEISGLREEIGSSKQLEIELKERTQGLEREVERLNNGLVKELRGEIQKLEIEMNQMAKLSLLSQEKLAASEKESKDLENEIDRQAAEYEKYIDEANQEREQLEEELKQANFLKERNTRDLQTKDLEILNLKEAKDNLETELGSKDSQIRLMNVELKKKVVDSEGYLKGKENLIEKLEAKLRSREEDIEGLQAQILSQERKLDTLRLEFESKEENMRRLATDLDKTSMLSEERNDQLEKLREEKRQLKKVLKEVDDSLKATVEKTNKQVELNKSKAGFIDKLNLELEEKNKKIDELQKELKAKEELILATTKSQNKQEESTRELELALKNEREKAKEAQNLQSQLKLKFEELVTENDKNLSKLSKSVQDANESSGRLKELETFVSELKSSKLESENIYQITKKDLENLTADFGKQKETLEKVQSELRDVVKHRGELEMSIAGFTENQKSLNEEIVSLTGRLKQAADENDKLFSSLNSESKNKEEIVQQLQNERLNEIQELRSKIKEIEQNHKEILVSIVEEKETELKKLKSENEDGSEIRRSLESKIVEYDRKVSSLEESKNIFEKSLEIERVEHRNLQNALKEEIREVQKKLQDKEETSIGVMRKLEHVTQDVQSLKDSVKAKEKELAQQEEGSKKLKLAIENQKQNIEELVKTQEGLRMELEKTTAELMDSRDQYEGISDTLNVKLLENQLLLEERANFKEEMNNFEGFKDQLNLIKATNQDLMQQIIDKSKIIDENIVKIRELEIGAERKQNELNRNKQEISEFDAILEEQKKNMQIKIDGLASTNSNLKEKLQNTTVEKNRLQIELKEANEKISEFGLQLEREKKKSSESEKNYRERKEELKGVQDKLEEKIREIDQLSKTRESEAKIFSVEKSALTQTVGESQKRVLWIEAELERLREENQGLRRGEESNISKISKDLHSENMEKSELVGRVKEMASNLEHYRLKYEQEKEISIGLRATIFAEEKKKHELEDKLAQSLEREANSLRNPKIVHYDSDLVTRWRLIAISKELKVLKMRYAVMLMLWSKARPWLAKGKRLQRENEKLVGDLMTQTKKLILIEGKRSEVETQLAVKENQLEEAVSNKTLKSEADINVSSVQVSVERTKTMENKGASLKLLLKDTLLMLTNFFQFTMPPLEDTNNRQWDNFVSNLKLDIHDRLESLKDSNENYKQLYEDKCKESDILRERIAAKGKITE
jgi:chromosome segregation ATPase